jgi:hypothetical protein
LGKGGKRVCIKGVEGRKKDMKRKEGFRRNDRPEERVRRARQQVGENGYISRRRAQIEKEGKRERERKGKGRAKDSNSGSGWRLRRLRSRPPLQQTFSLP